MKFQQKLAIITVTVKGRLSDASKHESKLWSRFYKVV